VALEDATNQSIDRLHDDDDDDDDRKTDFIMMMIVSQAS
jgi:hypothetical protein